MDPVAIANLALGWLGVSPVSSFDDPSRTAELLRAQFAGLRRAVLEDRDWTFATDRMTLAKAEAPEFGFRSRYTIPSNVLRVISVAPGGSEDSPDAFALTLYPEECGSLAWTREGKYLLAETDAETLQVRAIVDVEDYSRFSPGFCQALAARIAADLCVALTENARLGTTLAQLYFQKLRDAAANDGRQGSSRTFKATSLARRRR